VEYADRKIFHTCAIELGGIKLFQYGSLQKIKENFDYPQVDLRFLGSLKIASLNDLFTSASL
jgi:hypothetical protein